MVDGSNGSTLVSRGPIGPENELMSRGPIGSTIIGLMFHGPQIGTC